MEKFGSLTQVNIPAGFNRFAIPLKWAAIAVVSCIVIQFVAYHLILPSSFMGGTMIVLFLQQFPVIPLAFYVLCGMQQRKAMGGFITMREAFSAIFIVVLAVNVTLAAWGLFYTLYINPDLPQQLMDGYRAFMIRVEKPEAFIDQKMQEQKATFAQSLEASSFMLGLGQAILWHSIVAFICSLILRRRRPVID